MVTLVMLPYFYEKIFNNMKIYYICRITKIQQISLCKSIINLIYFQVFSTAISWDHLQLNDTITYPIHYQKGKCGLSMR